MDRSVLHIDLDTFFVSVERKENSALIGKPVMVGGGSDRAVVSGCSYEARAFGVHSGMPMKMARMLCSDAVVIRGDMERYSYYSRMVTDIIREGAPLYEKSSIDEFYLDLTGMDRFFGTLKWSHELRERIINETGLPISFGLSANKTVSKIATGEAKPNGELQIAQPAIKPFLDPLPIQKIPMLGKKTAHLLRSMGIVNIGVLSSMPPVLLTRVLGSNGLMLWKKANGQDDTPVVPYEDAKSMSSETTFETDVTDRAEMERILSSMTERLAFRLRKNNRLIGTVTVKIRYADFETHTMQKRIPYTAFDHVLVKNVKDIFGKLFSRRLRVRLIGIRFSELIGGNQQLDLFDETPELTRLYQSLDKIRRRFGEDAIHHAIGMHRHRVKGA
ncbi:MAG: DNA polymerase IV [Bacteroidetes bacterium GWF2_43_63]|nr:MAG: DNA polymerase IV [Bacteroidetes bacterium GWE2_42_42]OFY55135.1 MAG: DNA polymerase IV [Bacteroidetes bacterium GWF2_43_63]HBG70246.1 DNA polymerase IV [Bacteroidales bacterium]HCB63082.1 DNA polymerase IV [Bacteroidales bacterium]HCY22699.1 DNA polymerase IV [Bacteroidales bacterium]